MNDETIDLSQNSPSTPSNYRVMSRQILGVPTAPMAITLLRKSGIAKTDRSALNILLCMSCISFMLAVYIIYSIANPQTNLSTSEQDFAKQMEQKIESIKR